MNKERGYAVVGGAGVGLKSCGLCRRFEMYNGMPVWIDLTRVYYVHPIPSDSRYTYSCVAVVGGKEVRLRTPYAEVMDAIWEAHAICAEQ